MDLPAHLDRDRLDVEAQAGVTGSLAEVEGAKGHEALS
jgi:hypothetical protein